MQLDIAMVERLARYLTNLRSTQFIVVSLRPHMYEYSNCLVGVYRKGVLGSAKLHLTCSTLDRASTMNLDVLVFSIDVEIHSTQTGALTASRHTSIKPRW